MKILSYAFVVITTLVPGLSSAAEVTERFFLKNIISFHETNEIPIPKLDDTIYRYNNGTIELSGKNDSCSAEADKENNFSYEKTFSLTMRQTGEDDKFNRILKEVIGIDFHDFMHDVSRVIHVRSYSANKDYCKFITYAPLYRTKAGDIVMLDNNYFYFFKRRPEINYAVTPLPITDSAISCMYKDRCDKHFVLYHNDHPTKFEEPYVDRFYQLPSIGDMEVYLGWEIVGDDDIDHLVYLITIKYNKLNYVRIGRKFTKFRIDKDYSVIEGTDLHGKPAKFAIKSNGVIIKKP